MSAAAAALLPPDLVPPADVLGVVDELTEQSVQLAVRQEAPAISGTTSAGGRAMDVSTGPERGR